MNKLIIASRGSDLAITQAEFARTQINKLYPELLIEIIKIKTKGDIFTKKKISDIGGKGLFIKELQLALMNHDADIAIHSLKDMSIHPSDNFITPVVFARIDSSDCFISNNYESINAMPNGATIGSSSLRRTHFIKHFYPHINIKLLRGNVNTRLEKLDNSEYDAIILATAGVKRLNLTHRIRQQFETNHCIPAIGQGVIAIEMLASRLDLMLLLNPLEDIDTFLVVKIEAEIGRLLNVDCGSAIGIHAIIKYDDNIYLDIMYVNDACRQFCHISIFDHKNNYLKLIELAIEQLMEYGVKDIKLPIVAF